MAMGPQLACASRPGLPACSLIDPIGHRYNKAASSALHSQLYVYMYSPKCRLSVLCRILTHTTARQGSRSHPQLRHKGRSRRASRVRLLPRRANGSEPAPRSGMGPVTPRVSEEGKLRANSRGREPP